MEDYHIDTPQGRQEVIITQQIHASPLEVFKTLIDPLKVPQYWGPERLTTTVHKMTAMPGGSWRYVQKDKEGKEYAFHGVYHEIEVPHRLVYTSEYEGMPGHVTLHTEDLQGQNGETTIIAHIVFQSVEDRDQMVQWGMEEGVREMTRRLNELLAQENIQAGKEPIMERFDDMEERGECITITRTFDAPRKEVWERWTDPEEYMCWWGPKDFTSPFARFDLRPGGRYLSCMRGPDGKEYWDSGRFEEIDKLNRIVYTDSFADEKGNPVPPSYYGMKGDQPIEMAVQVILEEDGDGRTRMTLEHCGLFEREMLDQAKEGWNQSFDKLAECLR
jgi:uncharacterized protein YndB with AHSA1/START domain